MLQTSVKFDHSVVKVTLSGDSARFLEPRCISWWRKASEINRECGDDGPDARAADHVPGFVCIVDGTTGLRPNSFGSGPSAVSRLYLLNEFWETLRVWHPRQYSDLAVGQSDLSVVETKQRVEKLGLTRYSEAKRVLLWNWFPDWANAKCVERPADHTGVFVLS